MTVQSAIYLAGNKRLLWEQIKPFLQGRDTLVDLFTGSATIALNATSEGIFKTIYANDSMTPLVELHKALQKEEFAERANLVDEMYPYTKEGYLMMRDSYNKHPSPELLLNLQYRSNSNMMRFNSSGEFNMTFGERHCFKRDRLEQHTALCKDITFTNENFADFIMSNKLSDCKADETLVYIDSPYINTTATYNEQGAWIEEDDKKNLTLALYMHTLGYKVVISNVLTNRGVDNVILQEALDTYLKDSFDIHHLKRDYGNSSFRKSKHKTDEVLLVSKGR